MLTRDIIAGTITTEGVDYPLELLRQEVLRKFDAGNFEVFRYDNTVLLVGERDGLYTVHLHSVGAGTSLLGHIAAFGRDVWGRIKSEVVYAPIKNEKVGRLAQRYGWVKLEKIHPLYTLYMLERK